MKPLVFALALAAATAAAPVAADERAEICFNYGCTSRGEVLFTEGDLKHVQGFFSAVRSPDEERSAIAQAMAWFYVHAGTQTPVWRDRGGNIEDDGVEGRMDCIDHSTNTTTWLGFLREKGWLRYHDVGERIQRGRLLWVHWGARIREQGGGDYVVDTWFLDPGHPATIYPLDVWMGGARPPGTELIRWN
jgi:hypothetical protein